MTPTTYGRIERGQHTQTRKLQDIADVFSVGIEAVLSTAVSPSDEHARIQAIVERVKRELESRPPTVEQAMDSMHRAARQEEAREEREARQQSNGRKRRSGRKK